MSNMTEQLFISSVEELLKNETLRANAALMAKRLQAENGVQNAATLIESGS
jgi:UDP:flavonoid glycosyltransferase YjiC (YdhE family)